MQVMMNGVKKNLFLPLILLVLAGCVSTGFGSPWNHNRYDRPADQAPKQLTAEEALYYPADNEVQAEDIGMEFINGQGQEQQLQNQNTRYDSRRQLPYYRSGKPSYGKEKPSFSQKNTMPSYMRTVHVALLVPLSGEHADLGQALMKSAQMALFDLGTDNFTLIPRDTEGTPEGARRAAQSAIESGAELIIGPLFSGSVRAVKPLARRNDINMLAFSTDWSLAGDNTFIMGFLPFAQVQRVTQYALANDIKNIGILAPNNDYGNAVIASFHSLSYRLGLETAQVVRFPADESDISGIVRSFAQYDERVAALQKEMLPYKIMLEENPNDEVAKEKLKELEELDTWGETPFDAVLLPVGGEQARSIANLLSYYDLGPEKVKRLGTGLWDNSGLASEQSLDGAWYAAPSSESRATFEKNYRKLYNTNPPRLSTLAYDATALAIVLAKNGLRHSGTPAFDRISIMNNNGFAGIDGIFRFRPDGLVERGLAVMEIKKKNVIERDPAPRTFQLYAHNGSNN